MGGYWPALSTYLSNIFLHFDLGDSITGTHTTANIIFRASKTLVLVGCSFVVISVVGVGLGLLAAFHKDSVLDSGIRSVTLVFASIPNYLLGILLALIFCLWLRILPPHGSSSLKHYIMPVISISVGGIASVARMTRAEAIAVLNKPYIRTARAKGLREKVVIYSHAWRNALLPVITSILGWFLGIFGGSVIIENTFSLNGMGKLYWQGLNNMDFELVLAIQMFYSIVSLIGSLLIDISYGLVDPRVRVDK
jgi:peptide/nickel transport system permease protein